jgi:hypothetical protein
MTSFSSKNKRFAISLIGLFCGLLSLSSVSAQPGNEAGTKGTGSAGKSVVTQVL